MVDPFSSKHNVIGKTVPLLACDIFIIAEICKIGKSKKKKNVKYDIKCNIFLYVFKIYLKPDYKTHLPKIYIVL